MPGAPSIPIVEAWRRELIRNERIAHVGLKHGERIREAPPRPRGASGTDLVVPGMLGLEIGIESASAGLRIGELGSRGRFERGAEVPVHCQGLRWVHGDTERSRERTHQSITRV